MINFRSVNNRIPISLCYCSANRNSFRESSSQPATSKVLLFSFLLKNRNWCLDQCIIFKNCRNERARKYTMFTLIYISLISFVTIITIGTIYPEMEFWFPLVQAIVSEVGHPICKLLLATSHYHLINYVPFATTVRYANIMELVHVKDVKGFSRYFDRSSYAEIETVFGDKAFTTVVSLSTISYPDVHTLW